MAHATEYANPPSNISYRRPLAGHNLLFKRRAGAIHPSAFPRSARSRRSVNPRQIPRPRLFAVARRFRPLSCTGSQFPERDPAVIVRKTRQLRKSRSEQRLRAARIAPAVMMKRGSNLNQPLKEGLLRLRFRQPKFLPHLMRLEKLVPVEECDAAPEFFAFFHRALIQFSIDFYRGRVAVRGLFRPS
jgi:hypothetical protein